MRALGKSKIINGVQHHLYEINPEEDWSEFDWLLSYDQEPCGSLKGESNWFWVPMRKYESVR